MWKDELFSAGIWIFNNRSSYQWCSKRRHNSNLYDFLCSRMWKFINWEPFSMSLPTLAKEYIKLTIILPHHFEIKKRWIFSLLHTGTYPHFPRLNLLEFLDYCAPQESSAMTLPKKRQRWNRGLWADIVIYSIEEAYYLRSKYTNR